MIQSLRFREKLCSTLVYDLQLKYDWYKKKHTFPSSSEIGLHFLMVRHLTFWIVPCKKNGNLTDQF